MKSSENSPSEKINVFCFLDNALGRDTEIVLPVCYALEKYHNCQISYFFIWDIYEIKKQVPDMVLLPNTRGHHMYVEIAEYAYKNDIKVLALESEGNFKTDGTFNYWGYNLKKKVYQEWVTSWSERTKQYLEKIIDSEKEKVVLTGGTGFDKYQILESKDRKTILTKYNKENFKKVIGYAGWSFGKLYGSHKNISFKLVYPEDKEKKYKWVEYHRIFVRDILKTAIENNPDILFILKKHPKETFESDIKEGLNEMNELAHYENVLYLRKEEDVMDLINISDIWMGFKTTTALEAWILGKPTILINDGHKYSIDNLFKGSVIANKSSTLQEYIKEYYTTHKIRKFNEPEIKSTRNQIIGDSIGFADGLNHMRATDYFAKSLTKRKVNYKPKLSLRHLRLYYLMHLGKYFYQKNIFKVLPYFNKTIYVFENRNLPGFHAFKKKYYKSLEVFHTENDVHQF
ncbi:MAG: BFO_1060 family glycosyltransferase [Bacteroidota bacterium]